MSETNPRISLTKKQIEAGAGLELLGICQSITSDGRIADEEIQALTLWLKQNATTDLPSIRFLSACMARALQDGVITTEERQSIAKAIEVVLPVSERKYAAALRRQVEQQDRAQEKNATLKTRQEARDRRELNRPIGDADFMVAGTRHEGRSAIINKEVRPGTAAFLKREKNNPHSSNAIAILTPSGRTIGYAPEDWALDIAPLLDDGAQHTASFKKILSYETGPVPVVVCRFYEASSTTPGAVRQDQAPTPKHPSSTKPKRPQLKHSKAQPIKAWAAILALIIVFMALWLTLK